MIVSKFIIDKNIIDNEFKVLNNTLNQQRQLKKTLLLYLEKISEGLYNANDPQDANSLISCLDSIKKSFENIKKNIDEIIELKNFLQNITKFETFDTSYFEKYNEKYLKIYDKITEDNIFYYSFMESLLKYMEVVFPETTSDFKEIETVNLKNEPTDTFTDFETKIEFPKNLDEEILKDFDKSFDLLNLQETLNPNISKDIPIVTTTSKTLEELESPPFVDAIVEENIKPEVKEEFLEKTLLISKKENQAILPYSVSELEQHFSNHPEKYSSLQDIIKKEYTVSLIDYKNSSFSRFREAFNLAKNKSKLSFIKALDLANELFFNSNLNPVIITACKNIDELDIYLSCLEDNELEDFKCFDIKYV